MRTSSRPCDRLPLRRCDHPLSAAEPRGLSARAAERGLTLAGPLLACRSRLSCVGVGGFPAHPWSPSGDRHFTRDRILEVLHEFCGARRSRGTSTGYRAMRQRAPISERPAVVSRDHRVSSHWYDSEETQVSMTSEPAGAPGRRAWIGPRTTTRSASSTTTARSWTGSPSPTTRPGWRRMCRRLLTAGVEQVGIERGDGPVVEALLQAGLTVYVIPPGQVKNLRSRYGSAGNKDDRFDAYVLADVVRTDARRLRPMVFDTEQTTTLRATVRARRDLVAHRVARRQPAAGPPADRLPRRRNTVQRHAQGRHVGVPGPVHHPGPGRLAVRQAPGRLAEERVLPRRGPRRDALRPPRRGPARGGRPTRPGARGDHHSVGGRAADAEHPDPRPGGPASTTSSTPTPTRDLHLLPRSGHGAGGPAARRDRRCPRPVPHPRLARRPRRAHPLHETVRAR